MLCFLCFFVFFFKQKTAYEIRLSLVGSEMCIRDSRQVCGLFPWGSPGQLPLAGAPIGRHQRYRAVVCFDHVSWFRAHRIANPSVLIISKPGLGKSTLSSKLMLWLAALGYVLLIPGDTKPDYVEPVSYTHLRAHETKANLVCRLLLEKKK